MLLSVVIPCYNKEQVLENSIHRLVDLFHSKEYLSGQIEILLVIEKSSDNTLVKALELSHKFPYIKIFENYKKCRREYSVKKGVLNSQGQYILVTDADLPIDLNKYFDAMFSLLSHSSESAAVYAEKRTLLRALPSFSLCKLYKSEPLKNCIKEGHKIEEHAVRISLFSEKSTVKVTDIISSKVVFFHYALNRKEALNNLNSSTVLKLARNSFIFFIIATALTIMFPKFIQALGSKDYTINIIQNNNDVFTSAPMQNVVGSYAKKKSQPQK